MALEKGDAHYHLCLFPLEIESKQTQVGQKEDLETRFSESEETSDLSDHVPSNENLVHCAAHVQRMWSDLLDRMCVRLGERDWVDRKTLDAYFASCSPGFQLVSLRSERPKWDAEEKRFRVRLEFFRITLRKRLEMDMDMDMDVGESFEVKEIGADGAGAGDTNSVIQNPSLCYVLPSFNSASIIGVQSNHAISFEDTRFSSPEEINTYWRRMYGIENILDGCKTLCRVQFPFGSTVYTYPMSAILRAIPCREPVALSGLSLDERSQVYAWMHRLQVAFSSLLLETKESENMLFQFFHPTSNHAASFERISSPGVWKNAIRSPDNKVYQTLGKRQRDEMDK